MKNQFEIIDKSFERLIDNSELSTLATGFTFIEGPVWYDNSLLFSDIPNSRIIRYELREEGPSVNTFRHPSGNSNGMTLDLNNNLIVCEHSTRRVTSYLHYIVRWLREGAKLQLRCRICQYFRIRVCNLDLTL